MNVTWSRLRLGVMGAGLLVLATAPPGLAVLSLSNETRLSEPTAKAPHGIVTANVVETVACPGCLDLVTANQSGGSVSILAGNGDGTFTQVGGNVLVGSSPLAVDAGDCNGDGLPDLFVANGHVYTQADLPNAGSSYAQPKILYLGTPAGRFVRFTGPGSEALATPKVSRAAAFGDLDDDGDTDVVVVNLNDRPTVLRCDAPPGNWIGIAVAGPKGNPHGLGATVTVAGDGWARTQFVRAQASFQSTNDPRLLFRLRASEHPNRVEIALPGRAPQRFDPPPAGRWHELRVR
jgi:hypothetical protein